VPGCTKGLNLRARRRSDTRRLHPPDHLRADLVGGRLPLCGEDGTVRSLHRRNAAATMHRRVLSPQSGTDEWLTAIQPATDRSSPVLPVSPPEAAIERLALPSGTNSRPRLSTLERATCRSPGGTPTTSIAGREANGRGGKIPAAARRPLHLRRPQDLRIAPSRRFRTGDSPGHFVSSLHANTSNSRARSRPRGRHASCSHAPSRGLTNSPVHGGWRMRSLFSSLAVATLALGVLGRLITRASVDAPDPNAGPAH
jgi:hypothetical protein